MGGRTPILPAFTMRDFIDYINNMAKTDIKKVKVQDDQVMHTIEMAMCTDSSPKVLLPHIHLYLSLIQDYNTRTSILLVTMPTMGLQMTIPWIILMLTMSRYDCLGASPPFMLEHSLLSYTKIGSRQGARYLYLSTIRVDFHAIGSRYMSV
jgi:hypothetical protein